MIYARIMRNDILRKRGAMLIVFLFILLSALLVAGGASLIVELNSALDQLMEAAKAPHFVQMHAGELSREKVERWAENQPSVREYQIAEMITVDGSQLYLGQRRSPEESSVMDISFVRQNARFDFLLDSGNQPAQVGPGEIGVPVYFAQESGVGLGDPVAVRSGDFVREYTVASIIRDAQMNPAIVHSKRFLISPADYAELRAEFANLEYLIEFRLTEPEDVEAFSRAYQEAELPTGGPAVDFQLFKLLNGLSDGIVGLVVMLLSLVLMLIAILCLRFTLLATIEEDYREIGVMKAVGMPKRTIRRIYLAKYLALGGAAALLGYLASRPLHRLLTANIRVYAGEPPASAEQLLWPLLGVGAVVLMVILGAIIVLRRFNRITAVSALRSGGEPEAPRGRRGLPLRLAARSNLNLFLGVRDAILRFRLFGLQTFIFFFAAAAALVPIHVLSTMRSEAFITYMGIGRSDIRIDLRQTTSAAQRLHEITGRLATDDDVARFAPLITSQFTLLRQSGEVETFAVETGNLDQFPLEYLKGRAPKAEDEIALSYLNSQDLEKSLGDTILLRDNVSQRRLEVVGIYQDITHGGRTAKGVFSHNEDEVVALSVSLDLLPGISVDKKVREYSQLFDPARVTALDSYLRQTLGNTIAQLARVSIGAVILGLLISLLITSLFLRMLISKDSRRIAVMKSIGFSVRDLRLQYLTTSLLLLLIGFGGGTLFSNTLGQDLASFFWSFLGAAEIDFIIDPVLAYLVVPLLLMGTVAATTLATVGAIKEQTVAATIAE